MNQVLSNQLAKNFIPGISSVRFVEQLRCDMDYKVVTTDVPWRTLKKIVCTAPSVFADEESSYYLEKCFLEIERHGGYFSYLTSVDSPSKPEAALGAYVCAEILIIPFVFVETKVLVNANSVIKVLISSLMVHLSNESRNNFHTAELCYPKDDSFTSQHDLLLKYSDECFDDNEYPPTTKYRLSKECLKRFILE